MTDVEKRPSLAVVPNSVVDRGGNPRFGTYRGELPAVNLRQLRGRHRPGWLKWKLRRKRWHYTLVTTDEVLVCQAVVHGGFVGQGFLYVVDLYEERAVAECQLGGVPGVQAQINDRPGPGHRSAFRGPGVVYELERDERGGAYRWGCRLHPLHQRHRRGLELEATIQPGQAPALTVISPVGDGGVVNITQKWAGLEVQGRLRAGSRSYRLDGGLAGLDYTQGVLARRTSWRWAQGMGRLSDGRAVGLNLVAGFNDEDPTTNENALWVGDRMIPLERAQFEFDAEHPQRHWTVRTEDAAVELFFEPFHVYREQRRLGVLNTRFVQPAGRFELRMKLDGEYREATLFGVVEDQDVRW